MDPATRFKRPIRLETQRLVIRPLALADARDIFAYARDDTFPRYLLWPPHRTEADSRLFIARTAQALTDGRAAPWGLELQETGTIVGTCGFNALDASRMIAELGYTLARSLWGRGLATEAVRAVLSYGFGKMGLRRIEARCAILNRASGRVLEKVGMRVIRTGWYLNHHGERLDCQVWGLESGISE